MMTRLFVFFRSLLSSLIGSVKIRLQFNLKNTFIFFFIEVIKITES